MKTKKILFVGGPFDGYRKFDPRSSGVCSVIHTFIPPPPDAYVWSDQNLGIETATYNIHRFREEDGKEYEVAFHSTIINPMKALIKGYRYHRNKPDRQRRKIKAFFTGVPPYNFTHS